MVSARPKHFYLFTTLIAASTLGLAGWILMHLLDYPAEQATNFQPANDQASVAKFAVSAMRSELDSDQVFSEKAANARARVQTISQLLDAVLAKQSVGEKQSAMSALLSTLDQAQMRELATLLNEQQLTNSAFIALTTQVLEAWSTVAFLDAMSFASLRLPDEAAITAIQAILQQECAQWDSPKACIAQIPSSDKIDQAAYAISSLAAQQLNFAQALQWAAVVDHPAQKYALSQQLIEDWVMYESELAFEWASANPEFHKVAYRSLIRLLDEDPWQAYRYASLISDQHSALRDTAYERVIDRLVARRDTAAISAVVEAAVVHDVPVSMFGQAWAEADPIAAFNWSVQRGQADALAVLAIAQLTETDHWAAFDLIANAFLGSDSLKAELLEVILKNRRNESDFETMAAMLKTVQRENGDLLRYAAHIEAWVFNDSNAAMRLINTLPDTEDKTAWLISVALNLSSTNPLSAVAFAEAQASDALKTATLGSALEAWAHQNPTDLTAWLAKQPSSDILDQGIAIATDHLLASDHDEQTLRGLAELISNPEQRQKAIAVIESSRL